MEKAVRDSYGRTIEYMRISITDRCNLRCRYCMPDGAKWIPMSEILTYEEIERICREAVRIGITRFKITGGEPLVRKGCADLIRMIRQIPGTEEVTMTTNGVLLGENLEDLLAARLLAPGGSFYLVHRPFRLAELIVTLSKYKLEPKRMQLVYPYADREPNMVLLQAVRGGKPRMTVEKPLVIYKEPGVYTEEIYGIYGY